jgi:SPP1 family predicted phage head-tail adaptor
MDIPRSTVRSDRAPLGGMRHRLWLEAPVETADEAGGVRRSFAAVAAMWGALRPLRAEEGRTAGSPGQTLTHRVELHWRAGVDAGMRLRAGSRVLAIRSVVDPQERRRRLVCLCEEIRP